jgi:site-specific DNA recombinase
MATPEARPLRLFGYCRVSTDNQRDDGTIALQEQALAEHCTAQGYELVRTFRDEGISGAKELDNRPGLASLFDCLEQDSGIDGVIIYKLDRLARDLYIQEHLIRKLAQTGRRILSTKEPDLDGTDPMRKAFRQFMGIVSELEKAFITMRLSGGRLNKARKGGYAGGGVALGYKAEDKELALDNATAATVRLIFSLRRKRAGYRAIARTLNAQGIPTARGGRWHGGTVRYIVHNPIYRGRLAYKGVKCARPDLAYNTKAKAIAV